MKKIIYLTSVVLFLASCSKESASPELYVHSPHELNEIHEHIVDVVEQYAMDNKAKMNKVDFLDGLQDSLASYLHHATSTLDWIGVKGGGGVPLDLCKSLLANQRDVFRELNLETDTVGGVYLNATSADEVNFSDAYHSLKIEQNRLKLQPYDASLDAQHLDILSRAGDLVTEESNMMSVKVHNCVTTHSMFESGQWENIKELYAQPKDKFIISCLMAAIAAASALTLAVAGTSVVAGGISIAASISTLNKNSQPVYGPNGDIVGRQAWGLPHDTPDALHLHLNLVIGHCSAMLHLLEYHLDEE